MKIGCVVMAAGSSVRFGENKLAQLVDGKPIILRVLEAIPRECFEQVVVVTQFPAFSEYVKEFHFIDIRNEQPEKGISHTIQLGLSALPQDCDGVLFCVSDQPLLRRNSIEKLVERWKRSPEKIAALGHKGTRGNPCLFPARFFPELLSLMGDHGGGTVILRHEEDLMIVEANPKELMDVDTPDALNEVVNGL